MSFQQKLWSVSFEVPSDLADPFAESFNENALAVTVIAPPRTKMASIEALWAEKPDLAALTAPLAIIAALHKIEAPKLKIKQVPKLDWLQKVAGDFPPLPIARWTIYGAQHADKITNPRLALQIDATSAFGTGEHPTTRGCLEMLDKLFKQGTRPGRMLDIGCGSGVLAMAYAKTCRGKAVAIDLDPDSVGIARYNIGANGLRHHVRAALGNGYRSPLAKDKSFDLIMSNIFAGPLCQMAKDLRRHLKPGGVAILSGILNPQANRVIAAHRLQNIHIVRRLQLGEWTTLVLKRPMRAL